MSTLKLGKDVTVSLNPPDTIASTVSREPTSASGVEVFIGTKDLTKWWTAVGLQGSATTATAVLANVMAVDVVKAGWGGTINSHLTADSDVSNIANTTIMIVDNIAGWGFAGEVGLTSRATTAPITGHQAQNIGWTKTGAAVTGDVKTSGSVKTSTGQIGWWWDHQANQIKKLSSTAVTLAAGDVAVLGTPFAANNTKLTAASVQLADGWLSDTGFSDTASASEVPGGSGGETRALLAPQRARSLTVTTIGSRFNAAVFANGHGKRTGVSLTRASGTETLDCLIQSAWSASRADDRTQWTATLTIDDAA